MVPRLSFLPTFLGPVFSASRVQQVSDLHLKATKTTPCMEVWQTSNPWQLRLGEEKKKKKKEEEQTTAQIHNPPPIT